LVKGDVIRDDIIFFGVSNLPIIEEVASKTTKHGKH
jgi:hypothetical protein